jgi:hypothetical protein
MGTRPSLHYLAKQTHTPVVGASATIILRSGL